MRAIALLSTHNEERFITGCLEHLIHNGIEVHLLDDGSTDGTVERAETFLGNGLLAIERLNRGAHYEWEKVLHHKERLARDLDADWFLHVDADELRLPWEAGMTLRECLEQAAADGYNAVDFMEFTFVPTAEDSDHDHQGFTRTMRWYYPYQPFSPHRLTAWRKQDRPVDLAWAGGHIVRFPGQRIHPHRLPMKHYLYLSVPHAVAKYVRRRYHPGEVAYGWHGWRAHVRPADFQPPPRAMLRECLSDESLDASNPRSTYFVEDRVMARLQSAPAAQPA